MKRCCRLFVLVAGATSVTVGLLAPVATSGVGISISINISINTIVIVVIIIVVLL